LEDIFQWKVRDKKEGERNTCFSESLKFKILARVTHIGRPRSCILGGHDTLKFPILVIKKHMLFVVV